MTDGEDETPRFPPGVRFVPTDQELLEYYLMPKLMGKPFPSGLVRETEVYEHHPQNLLGTHRMDYFFTSRNRKYPNGKRPNRKASDGFWKANAIKMDIKGPVFGQKRILTYYIHDGTPKGKKTNWLMAEYTIPCSQLPLQDKKLDTWVVCKLYVSNREKNPNDSGDVLADQAIGSSSHSVVHEEAKELTETYNLQQDMATESGVQMLHNFSNHTNEQVYMPYYPSYVDRGIVMPNYMPLQPIAQTTEYDPLRFNQRHSNFQPPVILPNLPSSFTRYAEVGPSTSYANASIPISTIPPDFSTILSQVSDSELQDMTEIPEGNNASLPSEEQIIQCSPSRLNQRFLDFRPPTILAPLQSPFTGYEDVGPSTSYANAAVPISTSQSDFSTTLPQPFDLGFSDIEKLPDGNYVPIQSVAQTTQYDPSTLSQRPLNFQSPIIYTPPPSPFI